MWRGAPKAVWVVTGIGWLIFAAGVVSFIFLYFRHGGSNIPRAHWKSRWGWGQPQGVTFRDPEGQFRFDYPSDWDMSAPFERFTRHQVGSLAAIDTVALRHVNPTGVLVVIRYVAPRPMAASEWLKLTRLPGPLADIFGDAIQSRTMARFAGRPSLHVAAEGMVTDKLYRLESDFIPDGATAYRVTIGGPKGDFATAAPPLRQILSTFRFNSKHGRSALRHAEHE